jgi:hypothetical protein
VEAMRYVAKSSLRGALREFEASQGEWRPPKMFIEGVEISVRPEICLRRTIKADGTIHFGFVKLYICQRELHPVAGRFAAILLRRYARERIAGREIETPELCKVLDVLSGRYIESRESESAQLEEVERACREIRLAWPRV